MATVRKIIEWFVGESEKEKAEIAGITSYSDIRQRHRKYGVLVLASLILTIVLYISLRFNVTLEINEVMDSRAIFLMASMVYLGVGSKFMLVTAICVISLWGLTFKMYNLVILLRSFVTIWLMLLASTFICLTVISILK